MNKDYSNKLVLGTATFGLDYGINNASGKISGNNIFDILSFGNEKGIDTIDTASVYGDSEKNIGIVLNDLQFNIISKLPDCKSYDVRKYFFESLENLKQEKIFGYLIHSFDLYKKDKNIWKELIKLKAEGKVENIGFSLYYPEDIKTFLDDENFPDLIQVPYNVFDRRFESYFSQLMKMNIEIHSRSVFLQGLVFKTIETLPEYFMKLNGKITLLNSISEKVKISISDLCLCFVLLNEYVNKVVIGVDNIEQLKKLICAGSKIAKVKSVYNELLELKEDDENILLPFKWNIE
ncbi:MAG: aldo/keto reductase [Ignavibacteriae bacterium]|nr:aldo/keto reductase [Ignavibacteriota bacterium]